MKPCLFYAQSSVWRQTLHILQEVWEVAKELTRGDYERAAEELVDVQVACETLLHILGYDAGDRAMWRDYVDRKNEARGYHKEAR